MKKLLRITFVCSLLSTITLSYAANGNCPAPDQVNATKFDSAMSVYGGKWALVSHDVNADGKSWFVYYVTQLDDSVNTRDEAVKQGQLKFNAVKLARPTKNDITCEYTNDKNNSVFASLEKVFFAQ